MESGPKIKMPQYINNHVFQTLRWHAYNIQISYIVIAHMASKLRLVTSSITFVDLYKREMNYEIIVVICAIIVVRKRKKKN